MGRGDSASERFSAREDLKSDCTQKLRRWISCTPLNGSSTFILGAEVEPGLDHLEENQQLTCDDITETTTTAPPAPQELNDVGVLDSLLTLKDQSAVCSVRRLCCLFFNNWSQIPRQHSPEKPNVMLHQCRVSVITFTVSV